MMKELEARGVGLGRGVLRIVDGSGAATAAGSAPEEDNALFKLPALRSTALAGQQRGSRTTVL